MKVRFAETKEDIERCFPVMVQLRPHLAVDEFVVRVQRQRQEGYSLVYLEDDSSVKAVAGFRINEMLWCGRALYVDDLVTAEDERSKGYGDSLFDWMVEYARGQKCAQLDLDSGVQRAAAHRFYFRKRMHITCYHFSLRLDEDDN